MDDIVDKSHIEAARYIKKMVSVYMESKDLVLMGGYTKGQDKSIDEAQIMWPKIIEFIRQDQNNKSNFKESLTALMDIKPHENN
tara:strand:- start:752 stop:1003 length:252 start_codon:yes stop_codon:yes gene_type:complete